MSTISSSDKKRRFLLFVSIAAIAVLLIVLLSFMLFSPEKKETPSSLKTVRTDNVQGGAGGAGTAEYNKKVVEQDQRDAEAALKAGESHIAMPIGNGNQRLLTKKEDTPPAPKPVQPAVRTAQTPQRRTDNAMLKRMMDDLAQLDTRLGAVSSGQGSIVWLQDFSKEKTAQTTPVAATETDGENPLRLSVGDMLYAVVDTGVNSDVPSPVMATVTSGKYRKTRLIGQFKRFDERLVLTFNRALPPGGEAVQINAYAVDPNTTHASVASSSDTHFFERWGGLVASAFLEGLGDAKRFSGAQSTVYGYGNGVNGTTDQMVWNDYSIQDQMWIAAGKVGEKASRIFERGFDRPPTVYLDAGAPIGVLIMDVKQETQKK